MKEKKKILIGIGILVGILALVLIVLLISSRKTKTLTCSSIDNNIVITFKNNKVYYLKGNLKMEIPEDEHKEDIINIIKQKVSSNPEIFRYNEKANIIKYAFSYNEENMPAMENIGLNFGTYTKYKDIVKYLETSNYNCK